MRLEKSFYEQSAIDAAQNLLGKRLIYRETQGIILETEAYRGSDDPASHAARGRTPRNAIMFGPPGYVYVYMIYGLHFCLNIVCEEEGQPAAVLIRGIRTSEKLLDGPGKLCRHLGITLTENGTSLIDSPHFYLTQGVTPHDIKATARIGIRYGQEKLWRFVGHFGEPTAALYT
ncbi:3-methyladenine DNA glycosylase [Legionella geestiana]|uniref:Putative 3-methyladenine DNA glycosylase n=1 Tax=Legionella geestiana TaxID=45065 RepID=A0A0W0UAQ3_9GAMM|nr:DNA-3-methyladenine glycosylase [Legionella geestiana]KTD04679.1 3-methyladenine DNA glycosylase [Legionella geestiana]QBS11973.1 DNA-3-methyladenine glycosylase [Legionella geestiana]QDQ40417.1 DNA-3-methyladenine glycosylase [Legionella geestiana]STX53313.1 DNA-3-methyladenine glycosylase [Legionella geestiana]